MFFMQIMKTVNIVLLSKIYLINHSIIKSTFWQTVLLLQETL